MDERKYFIIVRLFKGWKEKLDLYKTCVQVYWSMRVEVNQMDFAPEGDEDFIKWNLLHQGYPLDTLQNAPLEELFENLPFDVLIKKDLTRAEMLDLRARLHTAIYPDGTSDDSMEEDYEPTYSEWMDEFSRTLEEFDIISVPNPDFDMIDWSVDNIEPQENGSE